MVENGRRTCVALLVAMAMIWIAGCAPEPGGGSGGSSSSGMSTFDAGATHGTIRSDPLHLSFAYAPSGSPRNRLAVLLNGTGAGPLSLSKMGATLAAEGFHVIGLRYSSDVGTQAACPNSQATSNPDCHRRLRGEVTFGAGVPDPDGRSFNHPSVSVSAADSVVHRLIRHVEYLDGRRPSAGWDQFQRHSGGACVQHPTYGGCTPEWSRIVAMGHSQGAGIGLYLAKHFGLDRVGMLSGSYDAFSNGSGGYVAAPWVAEGDFRTSTSRIATFSHLSDPALRIHRSVSTALGLPGPEVRITSSSPPYGFARRLVTDALPECPFDSAPAHNSTSTDLCAPADVNRRVWRYLAIGA